MSLYFYINNDKISLFYIHKALLRNAELHSLDIVSNLKSRNEQKAESYNILLY